jgi:non-specific serine/threonine protein kinase/serine/threonine-protein kinase
MSFPDADSLPDPTRVEELFHASAALAPAERADFLAHACGPDVRLRDAVAALLAAGQAATTTWERGALRLEARHCALYSRPAAPGEFFGPYRILRRIAAGGMSFVYEGLRDDSEFHKRIAIKFVQQGIDDADGLERFRTERQILAQLEHPNIAQLLDGGTTDDGVPYLVMEYVDGVPVDRFAVERRLSRTARLKLFLQVCDAVQYAHRNLVVHRDLKPGNILVTAEGIPKLLDFGIAKRLTGESVARTATARALTPEYASPEQVLGRNIGTASDVYSLGVLLFVLLAERRPYGAAAAQPADLLRAICEEDPVWEPAGLIQGDLHSILDKALRKEPDRRYLSVEQFAADIRRYLEELPVSARPDTFLYRARKFVKRRAILLAAAGAVLIAILAGGLSTLAQSRRAERRFNEVRSLAHSFLFDVYDSVSMLPGSLPTRRLLAGRAQQYLDSLAREATTDSALASELAESYLRLGDVRGGPYAANLGDTAGALESYRTARALLEREAALHPGDTVIQERLRQVYMNLGRVMARESDTTAAIEVLDRAIATAEALHRRRPQNPAYIESLARAYAYLAEAQSAAAEKTKSEVALQEVLATSRKALEIQEAAGPQAGESWQISLSSKYFHIGYALYALGDRTGDVSYYRHALENQLKGDAINRALAAAQPERAIRREFADGLSNVGRSRWKCCGDLTGAMRDYHQALEWFQIIAAADQQNLEARIDIANAWYSIGGILGEARRLPDALNASRKALAIYEDVSRADPANRETTLFIANTRRQIRALDVASAPSPR